VNEALERLNARGASEHCGLETELGKAEQEIQNIKEAVRHGKATATLLEMLEDAQVKAAQLPAQLEVDPAKTRGVARVVPQLVEEYARNLQETLNRGPQEARFMLAALLGHVVLRPEQDGLWAELTADLGVVLNGHVDSDGAGRGI
jgi:hypothetical protein